MADSHTLQAFVLLVLFIILPNPYSIETILLIGACSIIGTGGVFLINEAVVHGKAGPSQALTESQSLFLLVLEITVLGKIPNYIQVIGFTFGVVGGLCIIFETVKQTKGKGSEWY